MKVHYLEIGTHDIDAVCHACELSQRVSFSAPDELLGGARTATLADDSIVGVRGPFRETEATLVRPYWLVEDIDEAIAHVAAAGAGIAMPPMTVPGKGSFAIYIQGGNDHGLWQL